MDTNLVLELAKALVARSAGPGEASSGNTLILLIGMIIAATPPTLVALAAFLKAKESTSKSAENASALVVIGKNVDGTFTAMQAELKRLREEVLLLTKNLGNAEGRGDNIEKHLEVSRQRSELEILRAESLSRHEEANRRQVENFKQAWAELNPAPPTPKKVK